MGAREILVVDDDASVVEKISQVLDKHGYPLQIATTGREALAVFAPGRFQLAIVDSNLPDLGGNAAGLDVCAEFRKRDPAVRYVLLTADRDYDTAVRAIEIGADGLLQKPFPATQLIELIGRLMPARTPSTEEFRRSLGRVLTVWRTSRGLSLEQLGKQVGLSRSAISNIERGVTNVKVSALLKICAELGGKAHEALAEAENNMQNERR